MFLAPISLMASSLLKLLIDCFIFAKSLSFICTTDLAIQFNLSHRDWPLPGNFLMHLMFHFKDKFYCWCFIYFCFFLLSLSLEMHKPDESRLILKVISYSQEIMQNMCIVDYRAVYFRPLIWSNVAYNIV